MASDSESLDELYASDESFIDELECPEPRPTTHTIKPYQFEPYDENYSEACEVRPQEEPETGQVRRENTAWCKCECCIVMPTEKECLCCQEIPQLTSKIDSWDSSIGCITQHPGFQTVCLDVFVLQTAYLHYKQQYGPMNEETHEMLRYTAYRQLVRWCWNYLGRNVRVVLPACAVNAIRAAGPANQQYRGFLP